MAQGTYHTIEIFSPELQVEKLIWVYLPKSYHKKPKKNYAVLYMHDGQNLFDSTKAAFGFWDVGKKANALDIDCIIIGIAHGNQHRINELTPFVHQKYGGGDGDKYLDFIINTLKPTIDKRYRTKSDPQNTLMLGSSLGGLMSLYAGLTRSDVFGKIGVFSPSLWFSEEIYHLAEQTKTTEQKFYFMCGDQESEHLVAEMQRMLRIMESKTKPKKLFSKVVEGGKHNEKLWGNEFGAAIQWLLKK